MEGRRALVHGALPGETVTVQPLRGRHKILQGLTAAVHSASSLRVTPPCPHADVCGGCALQHMSLPGQRAHKRQVLAADLARAGVEPERWFETRYGAGEGYRRRARLGVRYVRARDEVLVGFRERLDRRFIARMDACAVLRPPAGTLVAPLAQLVGSLSIRAAVPQIEVAISDAACVLVFRVLEPPSDEDVDRMEAFGAAHDVHMYLQTGGLETIAPLRPSQEVTLSYVVDGLTLRFTPSSFVQVNGAMNEVLVQDALSLLALEPGLRVLDLFCGLGNFTLPIARRGVEVEGVEGDASLVALARSNAEHNAMSARFSTQDLYKDPGSAAWAKARWDRVLLDPPRTGAEEVVRVLGAMGPPRIVYVACGPESLARDLKILVQDHGYRLEGVGVVDMFPHTAHFESVALLTR